MRPVRPHPRPSPPLNVLLLVRHGEATANVAGQLVGRSDVALTERGRQQAAALGPHLGPVRRLISSPLRRALDTARALGTGCEVEVDHRWIEVDYGELEGKRPGDLAPELWQEWRRSVSFRPPDGESLVEVGQRVFAACEELFAVEGTGARATDGHVVVVSHVSPIKAAVGWALGTGDEVAWRLHLGTGSLTRLAWGGAGPLLEQYNWTPAPP